MSKKLTLASVAMLVLIIVIFFAVPAFAQVGVGDKAVDFTLPNVSGSGSVALSNYYDKPTMLVFWAGWCPHCETEMPTIMKVYKDLKAKGINVVGVSADKTMDDAKSFVDKMGMSFPSGFAGNEKGAAVFSAYGVDAVPTTYIIGKGGVVKAAYVGGVDEETLKKEFAKLGVK